MRNLKINSLKMIMVLIIMVLAGCTSESTGGVPAYQYSKTTLEIGRPAFTPSGWVMFEEGCRTPLDNDGQLKIVESIHMFLKRNFIYTPDGDTDTWNLLDLNNMVGDCDDFALTGYYLMNTYGVPKENLRLLVGTSPSGTHHAASAVVINGETYVLCNTEDFVVPLEFSSFSWEKVMINDRWYEVQ